MLSRGQSCSLPVSALGKHHGDRCFVLQCFVGNDCCLCVFGLQSITHLIRDPQDPALRHWSVLCSSGVKHTCCAAACCSCLCVSVGCERVSMLGDNLSRIGVPLLLLICDFMGCALPASNTAKS